MHYYQFNIGDYASHTKSLSLMEDLAYRRLLDEYYLHERPFNSGIATVARQIGMRDYQAEVEFILETFFTLSEAGWVSKRADEEINRFHELRQNASKAGKASAAKRSFNSRLTTVQPTMNQEPITNNHKPPLKPKAPAAPLPDWLDAELWADFKAHRIAAKSKMTPRAEALALADLANLKAEGHNPHEVIKQSIMRGWKGLFALPGKDENAAKRKNGTPAWWSSDAAIIAKGREVNLAPRPGESIHEFKGRVSERLSVPA